VRVDGLNGTVGLSLGADATQPWVGTRTNHALRLLTNNMEQMRVQANGNVGIGTPQPSQKLTLGSGNMLLPNANAGLHGNLYFGGLTDAGQTGLRLCGGLVNGTIPAGFIDVRTIDPNDGLRIRIDTTNGSVERMRVTANGNVGIGSTAPRRRLDVLGEIVATNRLTLAQDDTRAKMTWHLDNTTDRFRIFNQPNIDTNGTEWLSIDQGGNVSIHSTGFNTLTVGAGANGALKVRHINGKHWQTDTDDGLYLNWGTGQPVVVGSDGRPSDLLVTGKVSVNGGAVLAGVTIGCDAPGLDYPYQYETIGVAQSTMNLRLQSPNSIVLHTGGTERLSMDNQGRVRMGNTLGTLGYAPTPYHNGWGGGIRTWDIEAHRTIWSKSGYIQGNQDIAENYASAMGLEPGDVVCLDPEQDAVILSARPNDNLLLGVVSTKPAMLLNSEVEDRTVFPVALCGRVPCKVTDEGGPIRRGDLLTSSSTPGLAMKARPIRLGDQEVYAPGTILGKALGSLESGRSMMDIFVALS